MRVIAIIVLYNPEREKVIDNLRSISHQVDCLCLIDNSATSNDYIQLELPATIYLPQYKNLGIAAAQNVGLKYALKHQFDYVLFSDPDSKVPEDAVKSLYNTYQKINKAGLNVGALGSTAYSEVTNLPYQINDCFIREIEELGVKEVSYTMNSISLIKLDLFKECE